jgi:starch synthase
MHSLKYGVLPVARGTRGMDQIIADYDPSTDSGYGFLFYEYGSESFWDAIKRAKEVFVDRAEWERLMKRAITLDFSWALAAESYERLYGDLLAHTAAAA